MKSNTKNESKTNFWQEMMENRSKMKEEDFVEYHFYFFDPCESISWKTKSQELIQQIHHFVHTEVLQNRFIWQQEPFQLFPQASYRNQTIHLYGKTCFGDNIEDEWLIVYCLLKLTEKFSNLAIAVQDNDGQFLLIEAALVIPKWLSPEKSENRIFLYHGKIHLIKIPSKPSDIPIFPVSSQIKDVYTSLTLIRNYEQSTVASEAIQNAIQERIKEFPQQAFQSLFKVKCIVPIQVAILLKQHPQFISEAIRSFYYRDGLDWMTMKKRSHFTFHKKPLQVQTMVTMTRCLYAQLKHQECIPHDAEEVLPLKNHPLYKATLLGWKISSGMEIMYENSIKSSLHKSTFASMDMKQYDFYSSEQWMEYLRILQEKLNYFHDQPKGTSNYKLLEEEAKKTFVEYHSLNNLKDVSLFSKCSSRAVMDLLFSRVLASTSIDQVKKDFECKEIITEDDSEQWLYDFSDINKTVNKKRNQQKSSNKDSEAEYLKQAESIMKNMKSFLQGKSSFEGVEFPSNMTHDAQFDTLMNDMFQKEFNPSDEEEDEEGSVDEEDEDDMGPIDEEMVKIMREMDEELQQNNFKTNEEKNDSEVLKNLLQSYKLQGGVSGPLSNLFSQLNMDIPDDEDEYEDL